jgi:hypothetical protein
MTLLDLWWATCELTVLGPKCNTVACTKPTSHRVHWPSGAFDACEACTARWREIAATGFSMHLHVEELHYQHGGRDDTEQRFALMELDR